MKLAEALMERKAIKTKMEGLKKRIYQNSMVQEEENPIEDPLRMLDELRIETEKFEELIARINRTNNATLLLDGMTLMEAILKKDMLNYLHLVHVNLADKATPINDRFSHREIKFVPTVDISEIRQKADKIAQEYRRLDAKIQAANWKTDLI
ncbi:MAG: DIP1984 family protein [Chloroflexota bacterium]